MVTTGTVSKNPWRIATDVPLTSKELESAIASASILFWRENNGACKQRALFLAAAIIGGRRNKSGSVAVIFNDRYLRGTRFEAETRFSITCCLAAMQLQVICSNSLLHIVLHIVASVVIQELTRRA
jgi:hypothetical protein